MQRKIGLNNIFHEMRGRGMKWIIKTLCYELRYAWQRAWRGYDDTDVFELGSNFAKRMSVLLREFKEYNDCLFPDLDRNDGSSLTEAHTNAIIDEMIFYFDNCDEDVVYKRLYGSEPYEDGYSHAKWKRVTDECKSCWDEAMKLLSKWAECLWY